MSSAAMASSSVSQEDVDNDFEKFSRRSRIRIARGRDVRCQQQPTTAAAVVSSRTGGCDVMPEAEDGNEARHPDPSVYLVDHDSSSKPAARPKDKRFLGRPAHLNKGKPLRDRRKLREKRRSTGLVHMPSTESTGGSTNEDGTHSPDGTAIGGASGQQLQDSPQSGATACPHQPLGACQFRTSPLRNKSLSDLDADDEDNQDCDSLGHDPPDSAVTDPVTVPVDLAADADPAALIQRLQRQNACLLRGLQERDRKIISLQQAVKRIGQQRQHLRLENDSLTRSMQRLSAVDTGLGK